MAKINPIRFSNKWWDDETGLGWWGYRWYGEKLICWLIPDRNVNNKDLNLYQYLQNDPVNSVSRNKLIVDPGLRREVITRSANIKNGTATCDQRTGKVDVQVFVETCAGGCVASHENIHMAQQSACCQNLAAACADNPSQCTAYIAQYNTWMDINNNAMECMAYTDSITCYWGALTPKLKEEACECYDDMESQLFGLSLIKQYHCSQGSLPMTTCPAF